MREKIAGVCLAGALLLTMLGGCASTTKNQKIQWLNRHMPLQMIWGVR